jgi:cytochrome c peroxidase
MYQRMGLVRNYFELRGTPLTEADNGRFNVTHDEADRHRFKVPSLRNIELTAPYFHDGSQSELAGAVRIMGQVQLNRDLTDAQVSDIVAFLRSLTGTLPEHARMPAAAPTAATPAPTAPAAAPTAQ